MVRSLQLYIIIDVFVSKVVFKLSASEAVPGFDIKVALKEFLITDIDDFNRMAAITNVSLMNQFLSPFQEKALHSRAWTIQLLLVHYRYRNQPILISCFTVTSGSIISHLTFIQLSKGLKHIEFYLN